jgi:hypothetical protein
MSRMIRKQIYIEPEQDAMLKRRSRELGVTEAELIRRAIDTVGDTCIDDRPDLLAWNSLKDFIEQHRSLETPQIRRTWTRDDLYEDDERFKGMSH